jgi:3-methylcrotonyl-CoA carboxylase alpha subunit/acetyl-CoA/propionyl-CoA carboxylase biotin carboxyl carrier protein
VYAEDAFHGFLPQAGTATLVRWSSRARVDAALESGAEVGTAYDPMLGKVIAAGPTREAARRGLVAALDDTAILGLTTNLGFLRELADSDAFANSAIDTGWLDRNVDQVRPPDPDTAVLFAAWVVARHPSGFATTHQPGGPRGSTPPGPFDVADGWRLAGPPAPITVELDVGNGTRLVVVEPDRVDGHLVQPVATEEATYRLEIDGLVREATVLVDVHRVQVAHRGHTFVFGRPDPFAAGRRATTSDGTVTAPMPGTVFRVEVEVGDPVEEGQVLGVMEAMKMELSLRAPFTGAVARVAVTLGSQVPLGADLFVVERIEA